MIARIFEIIFPLFAIAGAGFVYGLWKSPEMSFANHLNMDVFVPALIIHVLSSKNFELATYGYLALGTVTIVLIAGLIALPVAALARIPAKTFVPPMMFVNSGNMGLPLAVFAFGKAALPAAVVIFLVSNVLHFTLGQYIMDHRAGFLRVLRIPMIHATLIGLVITLSGWSFPGPVAVTIEMLGQVSIPLMLFSLGVRLIDIDLTDWRTGLLGAVLCPLSGVAVALALLLFLNLPPLQANLLIAFGALPPAVLNFMVAETYKQEPARVASIVMLGNLMSVVSIPILLVFLLR
jgi:malate permease and related proteins